MSNSAGATDQEFTWLDVAEDEPEYVGVYEEPLGDVCGHWVETEDGHERCGEEATHTLVVRTHKLTELASCDEHGTPEHAGKTLHRRDIVTGADVYE